MAYSWDTPGELMPIRYIRSPAPPPDNGRKQYKARVEAWKKKRLFPQTILTEVACKERGNRCLACGEPVVDGRSPVHTATRAYRYSSPEMRAIHFWGTFCSPACRDDYVFGRWWCYAPHQMVTLNTLVDKVDSSPEFHNAVRFRRVREPVELFVEDVSSQVKNLPQDFVARWQWRKKWRARKGPKGKQQQEEKNVCDECKQPFAWPAFPMVLDITKVGKYVLHGGLKFCDPSCWKTHVLCETRWPENKYLPLGLLYCTKKLGLRRVFAAPPRECHEDFCDGGLTTEAYRNAPYQYLVYAYKVAPFVGSKLYCLRETQTEKEVLFARDVVDALVRAWELSTTKKGLTERQAERIASEVVESEGTMPKFSTRRKKKKKRQKRSKGGKEEHEDEEEEDNNNNIPVHEQFTTFVTLRKYMEEQQF